MMNIVSLGLDLAHTNLVILMFMILTMFVYLAVHQNFC
jgi:hypothetical protein